MRIRIAAILITLAATLLWAGGTSAGGPLILEARTTSSLTVSWNWNGQTTSAWDLAWRAQNDDDDAAWSSVRKTAVQRRHTISGLNAGAYYTIRVRALDADGRPFASLQGAFATHSVATISLPLDLRLLRGLAERLTLDLSSSRELCTAGTLTEISWQISGGKPPYKLQIEGSPVNADVEIIHLNCGALTEAEAADEDATLAAKRITATVTDAKGARREAAIEVARARALPAPTRLHAPAAVGLVLPYWRDVTRAGSQFPPEERNSDGYPLGAYLVRYRAVGETAWRYDRYGTLNDDWQRPGRAIFEMQVAALLHPLELATPAALTWSETLRYAEHRAPENVTATATHDTVTVSWDRQPYGGQGFVTVSQGEGASISRPFMETEDSGRWEVQFSHLLADTTYEVNVRMSGDRSNPRTTVSVRTQAAPPNAKPLPRGPKNLTATASHDLITVSWDAPFEGAEPRYLVQIFEADTNRNVDWTWPYQAPFEYTARGRIGRLQPGTTYRIDVTHLAIPEVKESIEITTQPAPE